MIGSIIGAGIGLAGSILGRKQQNEDQREMMELQAKLNQQQAQYNQGLAKDMWNYTSFPNQVKKIKDAGLNPALIYGMGGQGGSSSGAGQASGVGLSDAKGMQTGIAIQGMGLELANLASQIELNKSQAEKNKAEAEKTAGVDTQLAETETKLKERITNLQDTAEKVLNSQEKMNAANYFKIQAEERKVWEEARKAVVDAEIAEKTKDASIEAATIANWKNILAGIESISRTNLNEQQIEKLKNDMAVAWANIALGEKSVSNEADKIANDLMIGMKGLDIKERELLKDWIYEGVHAGKEISGEILNWVMRGAPKTITEVTSRLEEMFDAKGIETGSKMVKQTITKGSN